MNMQDQFAKLESKFYQIKDDHNEQSINALIDQLQQFIDTHKDVMDVPDQVMLAQAFELQLVLLVLTDQREKAELIEQTLDSEFSGIHRIGKSFDKASNTLNTMGGLLNISANLLDMDRLKVLAIKQKGTTKPKLLGWSLKTIGIVFIALAAWLFTKHWLWTPLVVGILGVLFCTIGTQVTRVVNKLLTTMAFNSGVIIPGVITRMDEKGYEAVFLASLTSKVGQTPRWGIKKVNFKKAAGDFKVGERLAGVCALNQVVNGYHPDFMVMPVCLGYRNEIIAYKAKLVIPDELWHQLATLLENNRKAINDTVLIVD